MKKLLCAIVAVLALVAFSLTGCKKDAKTSGAVVGSNGLPIIEDPSMTPSSYEEALIMGQRWEHDVVLIFSATWCDPCETMSQSVWSSTYVQEKLEDYVVYKVDVDRERTLANKFGVRTIPAYAIVDPAGKVLRMGTGQRGVEEIIDWLD